MPFHRAVAPICIKSLGHREFLLANSSMKQLINPSSGNETFSSDQVAIGQKRLIAQHHSFFFLFIVLKRNNIDYIHIPLKTS